MVFRFWLVFGLSCGIAAADSANDYFDNALRNAIPNPFIDKHDSPKFEIPRFGQDYQWRSKIAQVNTATGRCAIRLTEARRPGQSEFRNHRVSA